MYYGKPCNPNCYHFMKCDYCRKTSAMIHTLAKGLISDCGNKLFCRQNFYCKYAQRSLAYVSTKECQNINA